MLSLARIGRGREDYHLRSVGADASTYCSERGEVAGLWLGGGSESLDLTGRVGDQALLAVLAGYQPEAQPEGAGWIGQRLVAPPNEMPAAKFSDLNMLVSPGGRERTREEFSDLFAKSGFELTGVFPAGLHNVIEARQR